MFAAAKANLLLVFPNIPLNLFQPNLGQLS